MRALLCLFYIKNCISNINPFLAGPNVHLIGAITTSGVVVITKRRGSFTTIAAREWMEEVLSTWVDRGNSLEDLVVVCDNAPCHSSLTSLFENSPADLLRLGPYSPMLNPIENIWAKIKSHVKSAIGIPTVEGPGVGEQRITYLEGLIDDAVPTVTNSDCARSAQHSTSFHASVLNLEDMSPGS